jgi:AcrR family transcriptional regulator
MTSSVQPVEALSDRALRSRDKLKRATRELLNERGFHKLRIQDVTERAGVAAGLFYRYFHDLREIVHEISREFMDELNAETGVMTKAAHPYDQIFERHSLAVNLFAANPGVVRCLFQLDGDYPEFGQVWKTAAHDWNMQVAEFLSAFTPMPATQAVHMAFVLGAMTEGVFFQYLIRHTEDLSDMGREPDDIAEIIAVMWYRTIFLENPPAERLRSGRSLISA